jgi:NADH-quinone oxidoreductase subunit L
MVVGIVGAFMTAAYMTRCVYLTFYGEPRGAAADPHHHPHESGPRIVVPLYILSAAAMLVGFLNWPWASFGASTEMRFEHYVQPVGEYFPPVGTFSFSWGVAIVSTCIGLLGITVAYAYWWRGAFHGATEKSRLARAGYLVLENKYGFDILYTDIIVADVKGPIARGVYWFDQNVIDGVVNGVAWVARRTAGFIYNTVDQQVVDGAVNASGAAAEGSGSVLRKLQSGKVQQYGALLFGGAVIIAGILVFAI